MNRRTFIKAATSSIGISPLLYGASESEVIDLAKSAVIVPADATKRERKAAEVLAEECRKRSQLEWPVRDKPAAARETSIYLTTRKSATKARSKNAAIEHLPADGFAIASGIDGNGPWISIIGADERGLLFGVGRLLRTASFGKQTASVNTSLLNGAAAPKYPLRGHQLGYRPKTNSYDGWDVPLWDQYIRDLAVFGTNAIELLPPRTDDESDSPHFPLSQERMMIEMSRICDDYGLDVWIWYPAMDPDYADAATVETALKEWAHIYQTLPRVDAIFVPGGDPGHTEPKAMLAFLEKQKDSLKRYHPRAQMWMSPQGFRQEWMEEFFHLVDDRNTEAWLDGVVFGPQSRLSLTDFRKRLPKNYPVRLYPDITHSLQCQFPVPDWDIAYALTEGREVINPRPQGHANILRQYLPETIGFITYSEGCNDDVNKFLWSSLGWNPEMRVMDGLREFSRYFFGEPHADGMAQSLQNLEYNWRGPLETNGGVATTLASVRDMERHAPPALLENWRFQQMLYRVYYDASVRSRLIEEKAAVERAWDELSRVEEIGWGTEPLDISQHPGSLSANGLEPVILLDEAQRLLEAAIQEAAGHPLCTRVRELGEALFQSIHMQLAVERYRGEAVGRGANLDTLETPVTDVLWLRAQVQSIKKLASAGEQIAAIRLLLERTDPGPGGFYDEPGNPSNRPHVVLGLGSNEDPEFRHSVLTECNYPDRLGASVPIAWKHWGESLFDAPFRMRYHDLDSEVQYRIRVVYSSEASRVKIRLVANDNHEVHGFIQRPVPQRPLEFDIPAEAIKSGELNLAWTREQGLGGNGRGCQICEVWLIRK